MNIKVILCNCDGLKLMPESIDLNTLPFDLESDTNIAYTVTHPQLCGAGGTALLGDLLKISGPQDFFVVAGCGPANQVHFLHHVTEGAKFPDDRFVGVNIRGMNNDQARAAVLETIGRLLARKNEAISADAFGG